ncbi:hypothetical protein GQ55_3G329200 [Panicum hallii var. hallii]|uniref:Uncharacterized protein n=1 Tax=Panicum hallii var. hallii TaxID=1504633 RepID=A0A2T7EFI6_9POAL|nr:hypothetical protein GQ55_3G329200 [Panicum hallii var. hallii]
MPAREALTGRAWERCRSRGTLAPRGGRHRRAAELPRPRVEVPPLRPSAARTREHHRCQK